MFSHIFLEKAHGFDPPGQPGPGPQDRPFLEGEDRAARATFPHTSNGLRGGRKGAVIYIDIHNISIYCVHIYIYIFGGECLHGIFLWSCCNNSLSFYGSFWWFMVIYGYIHGDLWFCILYDYLYDDLYDHVDDYWFMVIYIIICLCLIVIYCV